MKAFALLGMLFAITFSCRILPFIFGKQLERLTLLKKISKTLPLCILLLLVAHTLKVSHAALPELIALIALVITHLTWRKTLLSMGVAVTCQQLLIVTLS